MECNDAKKRAEAENIKKLGNSGGVNTFILNRAVDRLESYTPPNRMFLKVVSTDINSPFPSVKYRGRG